MSADNWAVCPVCWDEEVRRVEFLRATAADAYGKVPVEEFDRLRTEAEKELDSTPFATLREDYEVGIFTDGEFYVSYSASCEKCGLTHNFSHSDQVTRVPSRG